ncbi:DUF58 domain-containing protein [Pseudoclavibacter sp. AY1F1]|uniref:DUF58 domain-containing protein n=1 Tax=Pseudoclavibacter sp. AY1F1 TaxID=2080583 RepID=UPI000CE7CCAF|nr:DUF58 domain-containing protein [Pseudoclavibacter sp. AY1F1]PPF45876.1 DUF58 domain-containing protein [Pseudoclavibacter sp. AY1F1]
MVVSGRLVLLTAVGAVPVVLFGQTTESAYLTLAIWLLFVLLASIADVLLAGAPREVSLERDLPARVRLGEDAVSRVAITNQGSRTLRLEARDGWEPTAGGTQLRAKLDVSPGERRLAEFPLQPSRRGERRAELVTLRSWGPMGLAARQVSLPNRGVLRVLPPFNSRKHLPSRLARLRELDGATRLMVRGQGTEFDSLREYVRGDDVRSIDWRATARRQDLVVRTWRPERDRRVVIVIDTGRTSAARVADESRLDTAIESALLLAALATRAGDRVDVVAWDRRVRARIQGVSGAELLSRMVESLADVEPELIATDWRAIPGLVRGVTTHRSLVVILSTLETAGTLEPVISALPQLTSKHVVVLGSVLNPDVHEVSVRRDTREQTYAASAAERALLDQERVRQTVRRLGGETVTGTPTALPPAIADHYIELKASGRL